MTTCSDIHVSSKLNIKAKYHCYRILRNYMKTTVFPTYMYMYIQIMNVPQILFATSKVQWRIINKSK